MKTWLTVITTLCSCGVLFGIGAALWTHEAPWLLISLMSAFAWFGIGLVPYIESK